MCFVGWRRKDAGDQIVVEKSFVIYTYEDFAFKQWGEYLFTLLDQHGYGYENVDFNPRIVTSSTKVTFFKCESIAKGKQHSDMVLYMINKKTNKNCQYPNAALQNVSILKLKLYSKPLFATNYIIFLSCSTRLRKLIKIR